MKFDDEICKGVSCPECSFNKGEDGCLLAKRLDEIEIIPEPCEDAISRQAVVGYLCTHCPDDAECFEDCDDIKNIKVLPPVNPTKIGKWILIDKELSRYKCSECGEIIKLHKKSEILSLTKDETLSDYPFSHCGARMIEAQERSDKE